MCDPVGPTAGFCRAFAPCGNEGAGIVVAAGAHPDAQARTDCASARHPHGTPAPGDIGAITDAPFMRAVGVPYLPACAPCHAFSASDGAPLRTIATRPCGL